MEVAERPRARAPRALGRFLRPGAREMASRLSLFGYLLIAPLMLWLILTILIPLIYSVYVSLTNQGIAGTQAQFIGLSNYATVLADPALRSAFVRSLVWAIGGAALQTILGFATALALNQTFKGRRFARTWIIISWIIPTIVLAIIWRWMLNATFGIVNYIIMGLGLTSTPVDFLGSPTWALPAVILINTWRWFPFLALMILAGLQTIPHEYYEAAQVDGASAWYRFIHITMPLLQPVMYVVGLIGTLWAFNVFDVIWLLTQGGPVDATTTMPVLVYIRAFQGFAMGQASAISALLALFLLIFSVLYIKFVPTGEGEVI